MPHKCSPPRSPDHDDEDRSDGEPHVGPSAGHRPVGRHEVSLISPALGMVGFSEQVREGFKGFSSLLNEFVYIKWVTKDCEVGDF